MKANVVNNNTMFGLSTNGERVCRIIAIDTDCFCRCTLRDRLSGIATFQLVSHRQDELEPTPTSFTSSLPVIAILGDERVSASHVTQGNAPGFVRKFVAAITFRVASI